MNEDYDQERLQGRRKLNSRSIFSGGKKKKKNTNRTDHSQEDSDRSKKNKKVLNFEKGL